jgi:hypothetical protein
MASINYYINQSVLGGTSAPRYADPLVTGAPNQDGLYPWSSFRARLGTISSAGRFSQFAGATYIAGLKINFLLFTSDVPIDGWVSETLGTGPINQGFITPALQVGVVGTPAFFKTLPSASADVTVSAGQVGVGYVATGAAAPNDYISATGFPASLDSVGVTGTTTTFDANVTANGAVVSSPVSTLNFGALTADAATCGFLPIILYYGAYTQAIRDAGNVFVSANSFTVDVKYQVVGLFSIGDDTPGPR